MSKAIDTPIKLPPVDDIVVKVLQLPTRNIKNKKKWSIIKILYYKYASIIGVYQTKTIRITFNLFIRYKYRKRRKRKNQNREPIIRFVI